jgi:hypothetical protein
VQDIKLDGISRIAVGGMSQQRLRKRGQYAAGTARKQVHPPRTHIRSTIEIQSEQGGDAALKERKMRRQIATAPPKWRNKMPNHDLKATSFDKPLERNLLDELLYEGVS